MFVFRWDCWLVLFTFLACLSLVFRANCLFFLYLRINRANIMLSTLYCNVKLVVPNIVLTARLNYYKTKNKKLLIHVVDGYYSFTSFGRPLLPFSLPFDKQAITKNNLSRTSADLNQTVRTVAAWRHVVASSAVISCEQPSAQSSSNVGTGVGTGERKFTHGPQSPWKCDFLRYI